jgi:7,8-dihydro-6-hydroxymethylpterin-pyrophosphokinase
MQNRAFVLVPLAEIAANWIDPNTQQIIATLKNQLDLLDIADIQAIA